jgi:VWFA-related protein
MKPNRLLVMFAVLLWAAVPAAAQRSKPSLPAKAPAAPAQPQDEFFLDVLDVTVVNVDVYVTDKKGNRVTGLTRDDFELTEDGKPVKITNFYAVEGGKPILTDGDGPTGGVAPDAADAAGKPAAPVIPEDQRLRLVIYIDNFNIHPFNRNRVMRDLRQFLRDKITREDRIMLVSYDREIHLRHAFTSDPDIIAQTLIELERVTGNAVHQESERRDALQRVEESNSASEALSAARSYAGSVFNDLSFSIDALKGITTSLAGLPGRKAILYVSDGIPMLAGQDVFYAVQNKYPDASALSSTFEFDASRRYRELTNQANANRVTFYAIDAGGLRTYSSLGADNPGTTGINQGPFIDSIQISNMQSPLQLIAQATGGSAVLNSNNVLPQLERIAGDFGTYYSLGYTPTHSGDGRYYKIDVKTKRKGLQVRHREGYRDKSVDSQMSDGTLAVLQFPYEANPLGVTLELGTGTRRDDGYYIMPIQVHIPLSKLVLVPREQTQEASVRLWVAAIDEKGDTSEVQQARIPISIPTNQVAAAKQKDYVYSVSLLMRRGNHKVGIGVRDEVASEASFVARNVNVGN